MSRCARWLGVLALGLGLVLAGIMFWKSSRRANEGAVETGAIFDAVAVGDAQVLLLRLSPNDERGARVELLERGAGERWSVAVPNRLYPSHRPVTVAGGVATVRSYEDGGPLFTMALAVADGQILWRGASSEAPAQKDGEFDEELVSASVGPQADAHGHFEIQGDSGTTVIALDRKSGREQWRSAPADPGFLYRGWLREARLVLQAWERLVLIDRNSGEKSDVVIAGAACVVDDAVVYATPARRLHMLDLSDLSIREVPAAVGDQLGLHEGSQLGGLCGRHRGTIVLSVEHSGPTAELVALDEATLTIAWRIDLGQRSFELGGQFAQQEVRGRSPDAVPLSGELPPFVPIILRGAAGSASEGTDDHALAMIDLESHAVAWTSTLDGAVQHYRAFSAGDLHVLSRDRDVLTVDGTTGRLLAAARIGSTGTVRPHQLAGDMLWVHGRHEVALVSLSELEAVWSYGDEVSIEELTPEVAEMLPGASRLH